MSEFTNIFAIFVFLLPYYMWWSYTRKFKKFKSENLAIESATENLRKTNEKSHDLQLQISTYQDEIKDLETIKVKLSKETNTLQEIFKENETKTNASRLASGLAEQRLNEIKKHITTEFPKVQNLQKKFNELTENLIKKELELGELLTLSTREKSIEFDITNLESKLKKLNFQKHEAEISIAELTSRLDLYSRLDEFACVGHFEMPDYLFSTSERYQAEIKAVRDSQRKIIKDKDAVIYPENLLLCQDSAMNKRVLNGQVQLMLNTFNIECDLLISKVGPSNLQRTLEQIEKKAEYLEKSCATLKCGFNIDYIDLKYEECKLQYEFSLKSAEEKEEQRLIRERMREEVRVQKQYEEALREAEKEEMKLVRLLDKAREHLKEENEQERALSIAKIELLEEQLREAHERGVRAKSMAEQTKRGFVYVISNIGSFGEGIYKIGLTRRLDPQERVDELGDASVPFQFDVHAMCYSEDAPALETALHRKLAYRRVNAVNLRKEFFRVSLEEIQTAIEEICETQFEFTTTNKAYEFYESRRLIEPADAQNVVMLEADEETSLA